MRGNLAFRVGRNRRSKGAARPPLQRSSGQDYISTGSGQEERKQFESGKKQYHNLLQAGR